jgi:hypothetical protein
MGARKSKVVFLVERCIFSILIRTSAVFNPVLVFVTHDSEFNCNLSIAFSLGVVRAFTFALNMLEWLWI